LPNDGVGRSKIGRPPFLILLSYSQGVLIFDPITPYTKF
jgi:hypothetical protein